MQAHEGESILSYLLSVPVLGKPPSGSSQAVFSTLVTNKQTKRLKNCVFRMYFATMYLAGLLLLGFLVTKNKKKHGRNNKNLQITCKYGS